MYIMLTFLEINGIRLECTKEEVAEAGLAVASGEMGHEDLLSEKSCRIGTYLLWFRQSYINWPLSPKNRRDNGLHSL